MELNKKNPLTLLFLWLHLLNGHNHLHDKLRKSLRKLENAYILVLFQYTLRNTLNEHIDSMPLE